jgi:hypothetical protein
LIDSSTYVGQNMVIGSLPHNGDPPGRVILQNGSAMTLSNSLYISDYFLQATNRLVIRNSVLTLGGQTSPGALTNRGILQVNGTIRGGNASAALVRIESIAGKPATLEVGNSIGTLLLSNANLEVSANAAVKLEFGTTSLDQIIAPNGFARLAGSNVFSLAAGAPAPVSGVKYGLGVYDFVIATNSDLSSAHYDNLVFMLTNQYGLTYGVDFQYGVVQLGGGLYALELTFVPEPSTVLLLGLGGLLVFRRRQGFGGQDRRRRMAKR